MQPEEEKLIRLKQKQSAQAISLAMEGRWREAIDLNREIVNNFPGDVETWNRLGRAHLELGEYARAREAYNRTLELDPYNSIARKNIQRLSYLKETAVNKTAEARRVDPQHFIEDIGKAGVVSLFDLAPKEVLARTVAGETVKLKMNGASLTVENDQGEYLGKVEPRHNQRLAKLMEGGNRYSAAVVSSKEDAMTVMVREVYQDPSLVGRLSFPPRGLEEFRPYVSDRVMKLEDDEAKESGYTIIGGEETEVLSEEADEGEEDEIEEEE